MGLDSAREQVARALSAIQGREIAACGTNTTLEISILESIVALDSEQASAVATLGDGNLVEHSDDGNVRPGQLQRLAALESAFYGDAATGQKGLLDTLREMPDPNVTRGQS